MYKKLQLVNDFSKFRNHCFIKLQSSLLSSVSSCNEKRGESNAFVYTPQTMIRLPLQGTWACLARCGWLLVLSGLLDCVCRGDRKGISSRV